MTIFILTYANYFIEEWYIIDVFHTKGSAEFHKEKLEKNKGYRDQYEIKEWEIKP